MIDVVSVPDALFTSPLWTNRQQMAVALARSRRARVLYVEPGRLRTGPPIEARHQRPGPRGLVEVDDGLFVLRTRLPVPYKVALSASAAQTTAALSWRAARAARQLGFAAPVLWSYSPLGWYFRKRFPTSPIVYDLVDDYLTQPNYAPLSLEDAHTSLIRVADLVLCTTESLRQAAMTAGARRATVVGNAADIDLFTKARALVDESSDTTGEYLLFWGAVTGDKLDLSMIQQLARATAGDLDLVFVGLLTPEAAVALRRLSNVRLLPTRRPDELLPLVAGSLACFIPYRESAYTASVSALKLYEAFAAGKQVIVSGMPSARAVADHVWMVRSLPEWEEAIHCIRSGQRRPEPPNLPAHSWDEKARRCLDEVERNLGREGIMGP